MLSDREKEIQVLSEALQGLKDDLLEKNNKIKQLRDAEQDMKLQQEEFERVKQSLDEKNEELRNIEQTLEFLQEEASTTKKALEDKIASTKNMLALSNFKVSLPCLASLITSSNSNFSYAVIEQHRLMISYALSSSRQLVCMRRSISVPPTTFSLKCHWLFSPKPNDEGTTSSARLWKLSREWLYVFLANLVSLCCM